MHAYITHFAPRPSLCPFRLTDHHPIQQPAAPAADDTGNDSSAAASSSSVSIVERVLRSNPLLEAFGNAKTGRWVGGKVVCVCVRLNAGMHVDVYAYVIVIGSRSLSLSLTHTHTHSQYSIDSHSLTHNTTQHMALGSAQRQLLALRQVPKARVHPGGGQQQQQQQQQRRRRRPGGGVALPGE